MLLMTIISLEDCHNYVNFISLFLQSTLYCTAYINLQNAYQANFTQVSSSLWYREVMCKMWICKTIVLF